MPLKFSVITVQNANRCNERLGYENRHHSCLLKEKSAQIDQLKEDLLQANIKCMSKSAEEFQLEDLKATIQSLQLQVTTMETGKTLLHEELVKQAERAMQAMSSAQVSQELVNKHLTNANRNRLALEESSKECDHLKSQCLELRQEIVRLGEQLKSITKEQQVHIFEQDLTKTTMELETVTKANQDLNEQNSQLQDVNEKLHQNLEEARMKLDVLKEDFSQQTCSVVIENQVTQTLWELISVESQTVLSFKGSEDNLVSCGAQTDSPLTQSLSCQTDESAVCLEQPPPTVSRWMQTDPPMSIWTESSTETELLYDASLSSTSSQHRVINFKQNNFDQRAILVTDSNKNMTSSSLDSFKCDSVTETVVYEECDMRENHYVHAACSSNQDLISFSHSYSGAKLLQSGDETSNAQKNTLKDLNLENSLLPPSLSYSSKLREELKGLSSEKKQISDLPKSCLKTEQFDVPSECDVPSQPDENFKRCMNNKVNITDCKQIMSSMLSSRQSLVKKARLAGDDHQFLSPMNLKPSEGMTYSWDLSHKISEKISAAKSLMTPSLAAELTVIAASKTNLISSAFVSRDKSGLTRLPTDKLQLSSYRQNQPPAKPQFSSHYQNQLSTNPQLSYKKLQTCQSNDAESTLKHKLVTETKLKVDDVCEPSKEIYHCVGDESNRTKRLRLQRSSGQKKSAVGSKIKKGNLVFLPNLVGSLSSDQKIEGQLRGILKGPTKNKQGSLRCVNFAEELEIHLHGLTQESQDCESVKTCDNFQQTKGQVVTDTVQVSGSEIITRTKLQSEDEDLIKNSQDVLFLDSED